MPSSYGSYASAINDLGQVVGVSSPNVGPRFTFVWTAADGMVDIGPTTGMTSVSAINDHGQVVGGDRVATLQFQLMNHAPVAFTGGPYVTTEGTPFPISLSATDVDGDALTYWWDFGGGVTGKGATPPKTFIYVGDNWTTTIALTVWDSKGGSDIKGTTVTVVNVAPTIPSGGLVGPATPIELTGGSWSARMQLSFTDPGWGDMHTAAIECGNGTTTLTPEQIDTPHTTTTTCTYTSAGVYTVRATVTDDDGAVSAPEFFRYVIIYDPNGASATGSGFYAVAGQTKGKASKAHFNFGAGFLPGQTVPNGTAKFWIPGGAVDFESSAIEMLVASGNRAQFWGTGTLNGAPARFRITAVAGSGGNKDAFRIELWQAGTLVFDTQPGAAQDAPVTTEIDGGNIQVRHE